MPDSSDHPLGQQEGERIFELLDHLETAGSLIESLESEVVQLRSDLDAANTTLRAARAEVETRGTALEQVQRDASDEVGLLREELQEVRLARTENEVQLRNEHINELAELRRTLEDQRRADVASASSDERVEALKEELSREKEALEDRHRADLRALESSSERWEEKLRDGYREQEQRHRLELDELLLEQERTRRELEGRLRAEFEERLNSERVAANERQEKTIAALNGASEGREADLEKNYRSVTESQQAEIESLRVEIQARNREFDEARRETAREVKNLAEKREREIKKSHTARFAESEREHERKLASLKSQREADLRALAARHEEEMARRSREYEERLLAEDERRRQETWALEERLEDLRIQRDAEMSAYNARITELTATRRALETASEENIGRVVSGFERRVQNLELKVSTADDALRTSMVLGERIERETRGLRDRQAANRRPASVGDSTAEVPLQADRSGEAHGHPSLEAVRIKELDARRILAEERAESLEKRLRAVEEENRRRSDELARARRDLAKLSDPERRLRDGIALFNESEHARAASSISKALGLPRVHARIGDEDAPGKPVLTFVWEGMAWRRYVADPTEGVEEPRVYLSGTGDDPEDLSGPELRPNARMDSRGRLTLGIQAR
ncbi:hypothetical protein [Rubrobacter indicoceani]|uniref:hypothetical protein n=1 Tax=Rubrobacter indicoceani TaxID=2051957 RepID=UPI0013C52539|nr:hypothetical protein [Rubrobacter indicoceani]